ncbi:MAG: right-handed parallel beta-helix repeat-containing protein [Anaerolineae bacterium]
MGTLAGNGLIAANGGNGICNGGSGGGGRVAIYAWGTMALPANHITATGGSGGAGSGQNGTVYLATTPHFVWSGPTNNLFHGIEPLTWNGLGLNPADYTAEIRAFHNGHAYEIGSRLPVNGLRHWDTTGVLDGRYELRVTFRDAAYRVVGEATRNVLINNSVTWHSGRINADETWPAGRVHVVEGEVTVASGVTLTIAAGAVVKFTPGTSVVIESGAVLTAPATVGNSIVLTSLADDTAGGDTNLDGSDTIPLPGDWAGIIVRGTGQANLTKYVDLRYVLATHTGTLAGSETWNGTFVHHITGDVVVPNGATLTIEPGAVVKFDWKKSLTVQPGGYLITQGTVAQPVVFTSSRDDSVGGDTNRDGDTTSPAAGDWRWIYLDSAVASIDHAVIAYGGGTSSGNWDQTGVLRTNGSTSLTVANSVVRNAFFDGILAWGGPVTVTNSLVIGADRGICAHPGSTVNVINSTVDDNRVGLLLHGGTLNVVNTLATYNLQHGFLHDYGAPNWTIRYSDFWNPGATNYGGIADQTGLNGNVSADPGYKDRAGGDYRLRYLSPAIDAADGTLAPATDFMGAPRYDDPRTANTGIPAPGGAYADMGAFEFVEGAGSNVDLVVTQVQGPLAATAGENVSVTWTVANIGPKPLSGRGMMATGYDPNLAVGPWHDTIYLERSGESIVAGEVLVGEGVVLGPGESHTFSALVRVPGGIVANYHWEVRTNTRGEVFEGPNNRNNTGRSAAGVTLDLPELVVDGAALDRTFAAVGESHWFKVNATAGQNVLVNLDRSGRGGASELYIGRGYVPTRERFDARSPEWNAADVSATIAVTQAQTSYVLAYAASLPAPSTGFSIRASTLGFTLTSVDPTIVGNVGPVTLQLRGGGLSPTATYEMVDSSNHAFTPTALSLVDSTLAYVTFDTTNWIAGAYHLRMRHQGKEVTAYNAVTVQQGGGPLVWAEIEGREAIRVGRTEQYRIVYGNSGNSDAPGGLVIVTGIPDGSTVALGPEFVVPSLPAGIGYQPPLYLRTDAGIVLLPLELPRMRPGARGTASFSINVPSGTDFELAAFVMAPFVAGTSSQDILAEKKNHLEGSPRSYQIPVQDQPGLKEAYRLAELWADKNNWSVNFYKGACVGVSSDLKDVLYRSALKPDSPLKGWTIERITKNCLGVGHTTVMLKSPYTGKYYIVDDYISPTVVPLIERAPGKWHIDPNYFFSTDAATNIYVYIDSILLFPCFFNGNYTRADLPESAKCAPPTGKHARRVSAKGSRDPNVKTTAGYGSAGYVSTGSLIPYTIHFENVATATAPAQRVVITDQLSQHLDWSTLELVQIGFNKVKIDIPEGLQHYQGRVNVASDPNPVQVQASFDPDTGEITWIMESVDPVTGGVPEDPLAGFLPPNDEQGRGEGFVRFRVRSVAGLANGQTIYNRARITFDVNPSIDTPVVTNTIDVEPPTSTVHPLPAISPPTFTVSWSGSDSGSGIAVYNIYRSVNGGPFELWQACTPMTQTVFAGAVGSTYSFYSVAADNLGHRQPTPTAAQATTVTRALLYLPLVMRNR